jgi:hypothetical protein
VSANATDNAAVARVDFYDGSALIGTDSAAPYQVSWITSVDGPHTLTAIAYDTAGLSSSDSRTVVVDNTPPTAAVTSPSGGSVTGTITITADSSDPAPGSGVASLQFLVDGNVIATDTSMPFSTSWDTATVTNGTHSIAVRAADGAGNVATSPPVQVTVDNAVPVVVMSISNLTGNGQVGFSTWTSWVDVSVIDQHGQPVAGATVTFAVSGGTTTSRSCTTAANGSCSTVNAKVSLPKSKKAVTYTTTDVTRAGTNWDGARWAVTLRLR